MYYPTLWRTTPGSLWNDAFSARREMDQLMDRLFGAAGQQTLTAWSPAVDVYETADEIRVTAELPGLTESDVNVTVQNGVLTISGEKKEEREEGKEGESHHLYERRYGHFERSFTLPRSVIADDVKARFADGVLSVTLPKSAEAKPRRVQIQSGARSGNAQRQEIEVGGRKAETAGNRK